MKPRVLSVSTNSLSTTGPPTKTHLTLPAFPRDAAKNSSRVDAWSWDPKHIECWLHPRCQSGESPQLESLDVGTRLGTKQIGLMPNSSATRVVVCCLESLKFK